MKAARIDQFIDFATDLNTLVSNTNIEQNENKKFRARDDLTKGPLRRKLSMLEKCISEDSNWIVPPELSIADIAIWRILG